MLCSRLRLRQSGPIFFICSIILATGFLLQFHILYKVHQKQNRIKEYNDDIAVLSESMDSVIRVANMTNNMLVKLKKAVANRKAHRRKLTRTKH